MMMLLNKSFILGLLMLLCLGIQQAVALPDLSTRQDIHSLTVAQDHVKTNVFYFWPASIGLAVRSDDGGPELAMSLARYSGSAVRNDSGEVSLRATLYLRLQMMPIESDVLQQVSAELRQKIGRRVTLRPMPINRLDASLLIPMLGEDDDHTVDLNAIVESVDQTSGHAQFWTERDMYLPLDAQTAELLERQLQSGGLSISLHYRFISRVFDSTHAAGEIEMSGHGELADELAQELEQALADIEVAAAAHTPVLVTIAADAISISLDTERYPSRIQRYDIDATLPPSYPSLAIYCYDFREQLRPDLFEKAIEIQATGVAGGTTTYTARFNNYQPDLYAQTVKFPFAVDLREPYQWREHQILNTGEQLSGDWQQSDSWVGIIDASSSAEQIEQNLRLLEQQ